MKYGLYGEQDTVVAISSIWANDGGWVKGIEHI